MVGLVIVFHCDKRWGGVMSLFEFERTKFWLRTYPYIDENIKCLGLGQDFF